MNTVEFCAKYRPRLWENESDDFVFSQLSQALSLELKRSGEGPIHPLLSTCTESDIERIAVLFCSILGQNFFCSRHELRTKSDVSIPYGINEVDNLRDILGRISGYLKDKKLISKMIISESKEFRLFGNVTLWRGKDLLLDIKVGWVFGESGAYILSIKDGSGITLSVESMVTSRLFALLNITQCASPQILFELFAITENLSFNVKTVNHMLGLGIFQNCFEYSSFPITERQVVNFYNSYEKWDLPDFVKSCGVIKPDFKSAFNRFSTLVKGCLNPSDLSRWDATDGMMSRSIATCPDIHSKDDVDYDLYLNAYSRIDKLCTIAFCSCNKDLTGNIFKSNPSILTEYVVLDGVFVGDFTYRFSPFAKDKAYSVPIRGNSTFRLPTAERMIVEGTLLESINHLKLPSSVLTDYVNKHSDLERLLQVAEYFHVPTELIVNLLEGAACGQ